MEIEKTTKSEEKDITFRFNQALHLIEKSQADLAKEIGVGASRINSYVTGKSEATVNIFIKLVFQEPSVNWFYVFGGDEYGSLDSPIKNLIPNLNSDITSIKKLSQDLEAITKDNAFMSKEILYLKEHVALYKKLLEKESNTPN